MRTTRRDPYHQAGDEMPVPTGAADVPQANGMAVPPTQFVSEQELLQVTGYRSRGALARNLSANDIPYFTGRGGRIWTTVALIARAAAAGPSTLSYEAIEF